MDTTLLMQFELDWRGLLEQAAMLLMPEMIIIMFACFALVLELMVTERQRRWSAYLSLAGLGAAGLSVYQMFRHVAEAGRPISGFYDMYVVDNFALVFKAILLLVAIFTVALSIKFLDVEREQRGEYYSLVLFATSGMMFMASGADLLSIFISFELMAVTTYVLVAYFKTDRRSNEAAMKYFLLGIFSSGIFLYGMSMIYGMTGETNLVRIAGALASLPPEQMTGFVATVGMIFMAAALFFKIAAVPFHMWCPDAYEGAPTSVTAFMSVGPKAAAFAIFARIFIDGLPNLRGDLAGKTPGWIGLLVVVSALTMTWGNLAALTQSSAKRLMAYSSISHAGYLLLGLIAGNKTGYTGLVIYLFVYVFMNLGAWGLIVAQRRADIQGELVDNFNGLIHRSPGMAVMMTIFLLSLTGIPPTAGFIGKYYLFAGLIETGEKWLVALAILAVLNTTVSLYYYARFIKAMFMGDVTEKEPLALSPSLRAALVTATVMVLLVGIYPNPFINFTEMAARQLLGL
ncbi:MAG: NADH-quinone oxidoreductase subunit N [Acidobacteria bacterium]|nr:NADH-quinone oxidoreductase subunit N [Acidobacteriota bacterium]